jgi:hypothetical protein
MRNAFARIHTNFFGKNVPHPIVVIESDDWGSHRIPSKQAYEKLLQKGLPLHKSPYTQFDGLERPEDVDALFHVLKKHKDAHGKHPVITANTLMGNPDFQRIETTQFQEFYRITLPETYQILQENTLTLFQQGLQEQLWMPQFHGREHVNIFSWLSHLKQQHPWFTLAFNEHVWGLSSDLIPGKSIQAAFDHEPASDVWPIIQEGLQDFERTFGFKSTSIIAPNYIWSEQLHEPLHRAGVQHFQSMKYQLLPKNTSQEKRRKLRHVTGEKTAFGQTFAVRNCHFEPTEKHHHISDTLKEIHSAFLWKKPAIICTHRINYTSRLEGSKRDENLKQLDLLLAEILKRWPNVQFMSTPELAHLLKN